MLLVAYYTKRSKKAASQVARCWLLSKTTGSSNLSLITNIINPLPRKILLPIFFGCIATEILDVFFYQVSKSISKIYNLSSAHKDFNWRLSSFRNQLETSFREGYRKSGENVASNHCNVLE